MKRYFFFCFFFIMFATQLNANEKIVFIDINYIFNNSDAGKKLQNEILEKNDQINNEINKFKIDKKIKKKNF